MRDNASYLLARASHTLVQFMFRTPDDGLAVAGVAFLCRHVFLPEVLHVCDDCFLFFRRPSDVCVVSAVTCDTGALPPVPCVDDLAIEAEILASCLLSALR